MCCLYVIAFVTGVWGISASVFSDVGGWANSPSSDTAERRRKRAEVGQDVILTALTISMTCLLLASILGSLNSRAKKGPNFNALPPANWTPSPEEDEELPEEELTEDHSLPGSTDDSA